jgi:hypothetical protein
MEFAGFPELTGLCQFLASNPELGMAEMDDVPMAQGADPVDTGPIHKGPVPAIQVPNQKLAILEEQLRMDSADVG